MAQPVLIVKQSQTPSIINNNEYTILFNTVEIIIEGKQKKAIYNVTHHLGADTWHTQHTFDDFSNFNDYLVAYLERNGVSILKLPVFPVRFLFIIFIKDYFLTLFY